MNITRLDTTADDFWPRLEKMLAWEGVSDDAVNDIVKEIIQAIRERGDAALVEYTNRFDRMSVDGMAELEIAGERLQQALDGLPADQRKALELAAERVRRYHQRQVQESWSYREDDGTLLGQQVTPLDCVGLYVPGGKAAYPSSVLMTAIPAKVAGVEELIMVAPTPDGEVNPLVLAAAAVCGVDRVFAVGGAQAVAALAYGTETVPQVDKVVGPGNIYVATAKRYVFGSVGIDMIAGPSEILVICDGDTDPDWIAMDLFSQAEHDEDAQSILLSPDAGFIERVANSIEKLLPTMDRWTRPSRWPTSSPPNTWSCRWRIPRPWCRASSTPAPSSWAATPPRPWATTVPAPTMCCPPRARRASLHRWGCMISRSAPA